MSNFGIFRSQRQYFFVGFLCLVETLHHCIGSSQHEPAFHVIGLIFQPRNKALQYRRKIGMTALRGHRRLLYSRLRQQSPCIAQPEIEGNRQYRQRQRRQCDGCDIPLAVQTSSRQGGSGSSCASLGECPAACAAAVPACSAHTARGSECRYANRYRVPQADPDKYSMLVASRATPDLRSLLLHSVGRTNSKAPTMNMPATTQNVVMRYYLCLPLTGLQLA